METIRDDIFRAIVREREYQIARYGDVKRSVSDCILILQAELDEAREAYVASNDNEMALLEILQVAAVAVACLEKNGIVISETRYRHAGL